MLGWVKYLLYIVSFFIPPVGIISLWVFAGRPDEELKMHAKWCMLAAFIGIVVYVILGAIGVSMRDWRGRF